MAATVTGSARRATQHAADVGPTAGDGEHDRQHTTDHTMRQAMSPNAFEPGELVPVEGEQSPEDVGGDPGEEASPLVVHRRTLPTTSPLP